jgi:hypothetical protein
VEVQLAVVRLREERLDAIGSRLVALPFDDRPRVKN